MPEQPEPLMPDTPHACNHSADCEGCFPMRTEQKEDDLSQTGVTLDACKRWVNVWIERMGLEPEIVEAVHIDSLRGFLPEEALADEKAPDAWAATIGNPDNTRFRIIVRPDTPWYKMEHIIAHEMVHVYSYSNCGNDLRANLELLTDQCALMMREMHGDTANE